MKTTILSLYGVVLSVFLLCAGQAEAAYRLDPGFAESGIAVEGIGNENDRAYGMAVQADGKIVVVGMSDNGSDTDVAVLRFNSDGSLDGSFAGEGKATFQIGSANDGAYGVVLQEDGKIVLAGFAEDSESKKNIILIRLYENGIEDNDFGVAGVARLEIADADAEASAVIIDDQGRLIVGGTAKSDTDSWAVAARFDIDGNLDDSFGANGFRLIEDDAKTSVESVVLQSDNKIVLAGMIDDGSLKQAALFRLLEDGGIDTRFGEAKSGKAVLDFVPDNTRFYSAGLQEDGAIIAAGYSTDGNYTSMAIARFLANGQLDTSFGDNGLAINDLGDDSVAYTVVVNSDGTLLIGGEAGNGNDSDIIMLELDGTGLKVASTVLTANGESSEDEGNSVTIDPLEVSEGISLEEYELIAALEESKALRTDIDGDDDHGRALVSVDGTRAFIAGYTYTGNFDDIAVLAFANETDARSAEITAIEDLAYLVGTISITNITRNSAMTGGVITENLQYSCRGDTSGTGDDCRPTVTERGVVYAVVPYPSYRVADDSDSSDDGGFGEDENRVFPDWVENSSYNYDTVRSGQTSDGTGDGIYGSDITEITPDVVYYVRAYAVLSEVTSPSGTTVAEGTVIYGNQLAFRTDDACFIATAAYGSLMEPHVTVLRTFRDKHLKTNLFGREFVKFYYHFSPGLAEFIAQSSLLRLAARIALIPIVGFSYFMVYVPLSMKLIIMLLAGGMVIFIQSKAVFSRR